MAERIRVTVEGPEWLEFDPLDGHLMIQTEQGRLKIIRTHKGIAVENGDSVSNPLVVRPRDEQSIRVEQDGLPF